MLLAGIGGLWAASTAEPVYSSPFGVLSAAQPPSSTEWALAADRSRQLVRDSLAERKLPGLSVAVGIGNQIVWAEGFGLADVESRQPVTPATRFRIGTASMALTSAAIGVLLEEGRLALDADIRSYVPGFPRKRWPVSLRQLMGHVAGVTSDSGDEGPLFSRRCDRPVDALQHFAEAELMFQPGTQYRPSKYGWILVSAAIEAAAREPFLTFMQSRIFKPLGMHDTTAESAAEENPERVGEPEEDPPLFTFVRHVLAELGIVDPKPVPKSRVPNLTTSYFPRFAADPRHGVHLMRPHNLSCYAGSMAFISTPSDLVRFALGINGGALLHAATVERLQTSQRLVTGEETGYGLGWALETAPLAGRPTRMAGHDGEMLGGMAASLMSFPERGIVVSVTSNVSYADTASIARGIAQAFAEP